MRRVLLDLLIGGCEHPCEARGSLFRVSLRPYAGGPSREATNGAISIRSDGEAAKDYAWLRVRSTSMARPLCVDHEAGEWPEAEVVAGRLSLPRRGNRRGLRTRVCGRGHAVRTKRERQTFVSHKCGGLPQLGNLRGKCKFAAKATLLPFISPSGPS